MILDPQFLSVDPAAANFMRLPATSSLGKAGAGGPWPKYIGPFPPGPPPKEGDWFTRLRDKWQDALEESQRSRDKSP